MEAITATGKHPAGNVQERSILRLLLAVYVLFTALAMLRHELWADELHSWNIARYSSSLPGLIHNMRYEGHPPAWLVLLWFLTRFTTDPVFMQLAQWLIAAAVVCLILFRSRVPLAVKCLLPFGYYFLFEYGILSRNYGIGVLFALLICQVMFRSGRYRIPVYYVLLFLLSNVHMLTLLLACSFHACFLLLQKERGAGFLITMVHLLLGAAVLLPAAWCIASPSGSGHTVMLLWQQTGFSRVAINAQAPLRAFVPLPAWWLYHSWNTQFLLELKGVYPSLRFLCPLLSVLILAWACVQLRGSRKALLLFAVNTVLTFLAGMVFTLHTERYAGFLFIGFIVAYILMYAEGKRAPDKKPVIVLLVIQLLAGVFMTVKDILLPFSHMDKIKQLAQKVPAGAALLTDYRAVNAGAAYLPRPLYCLDRQKTLSFILWEPDMQVLNSHRYRYADGAAVFFQHTGTREFYLVSCAPLQVLQLTDSLFPVLYQVRQVAGYPAPLDRESNLYLYKISRNRENH